MLNLEESLDINEWKLERSETPFKFKNIHYLETFNQWLYDIKNDYQGTIIYFKEGMPPLSYKYMSYMESTPLAHLFKFTPQSYFFNVFTPDYYWKNFKINSDVIDRLLSYNLNKYDLPNSQITYNFDYRLYVCQSNIAIDGAAIAKSGVWATKNKKHVIVRLGTILKFRTEYINFINMLFKKGVSSEFLIIDTDSDITNLVENCKCMWTANSGVGFHALLKGKSVSYFHKDSGHAYAPVANYTIDANIAYDENLKIDYNDVARYFSWYYNLICIDVLNPDHKQLLSDRICRYFTKGETVDELLSK